MFYFDWCFDIRYTRIYIYIIGRNIGLSYCGAETLTEFKASNRGHILNNNGLQTLPYKEPIQSCNFQDISVPNNDLRKMLTNHF
jgi:hypothetical protein